MIQSRGRSSRATHRPQYKSRLEVPSHARRLGSFETKRGLAGSNQKERRVTDLARETKESYLKFTVRGLQRNTCGERKPNLLLGLIVSPQIDPLPSD